MNTAEVAIEHILAGMLALCAFALPFISRPQISGKLSESAFIVAVLGAAYLFGVVFDRLADTILGPIEHYTRLKLAKGRKDQPPSQPDPFPQDLLEFSLRAAEGGRLAWMDSLRGRIRTCRAMCVLGAPAAMGIAIFVQWNTDGARLHWKPHSLVAVNLFLILILLLSQVLIQSLLAWTKESKTQEPERQEPKEQESKQQETKIEAWHRRFKKLTPPRTDQLNKKDEYMEPLTHALIFSSLYFLMLILSLFVTAWIVPGSPLKRLGILLGGAAVIGLSLLAWNQITRTYMSFVARQMEDRD